MPTIDERVVAMSFENGVFEQRVSVTMTTLSKLDTALKNMGGTTGFDKIEASASKVTLQQPMSALDKLKAKLSGAGQGAAEGFSEIDRAGNRVSLSGPAAALDKLQGKMGQLSAGSTFTDIEKASDRVTLSGLSNALENVTSKFSVLQGAASVALGNITSQAAMKGAAFGKSFAFGPIQQGLGEYQTNLNSIQTILANTQGQQVSGLGEVQKHLAELNTYSDQTIYNFSEMAKNIGTFTAAGVDLDTSTKSIKGIANLAALSGSNSQQASTAMYQLSQAISAGRVGLQDWNSVVNAGMGGAVFQKALMRTAENMGTVEKGAVKIDKATGKATINGQSFRESIMAKPGQKSWLSSDVLTKTLTQFTGDLSDAELAAQGFSAEQIKAIQAQAKTAQEAATQVKTLPQVFDVARETIGSGWSQTFQNIFGNFEESKKTFTSVSNALNGFINQNSNARNKVLKTWHDLGGRAQLFVGLENAFKAILAVIAPIKDAFRDIFPATTGVQLFEMTKNFAAFAKELMPGAQTVDNLRRTFRGLFAVLHIGWSIVKGVIGVIFDLLGAVGKGSGGFLSFTGGIGDFLTALDTAITKGGLLTGFFTALTSILKVPIQLFKALGGAIANLFGGDHQDAAKGLNDSLDAVNSKLGPLKGVVEALGKAWEKLVGFLGQAKAALEPWFSQMADKLSQIGTLFVDAFQNMDFNKVMSALQTGFVGGIFLMLKKAFGKGLPPVFGGTLEGVNKMLSALTGNLVAMQTKIKAQALLAIGAAILVLAGAVFILSKIKGDDLSKAMTAVAVGLGELMGAMKLMTSGMGKLGILQLPVIAAAMIGLAVAVLILAGAVKIFSTMNWEEIGKGLAGVAGAIVAIALGMKLMPMNLAITAAGLILLGIGLNIIAAAVEQFGKMKLEEIAKGIFAIVVALGGIALGVSQIPLTLPITAAGLILMGIALASIGGAIKAMGSMDFGTILKGLGAMIAAIVGIGLAVSLVPPTIALTAVGLLLVGQAMVVVAAAIALLGNLSVGALVKGLVGLAGALIILAAGLTLMIVALPGAAALMVAAGALAVLVPVLGLLGIMKWSTIFKGLAAVGLAMLTIGVAGVIAGPGLFALGLALIPLGVGFLLVAKAAKIFAEGIALLSDEGQKGFGVLLTAITGFIALLPTIVISFVKGLLSIVDQMAVLAPKVVMALGIIIDTIIAFVIESAPKLAIAIGVLVDSILQVLLTNSPKIIAAGVQLLNNLLSGISANIGQVTTKVSEIIVKFLAALAAKAPSLVAAGAKTLVSFLQGITNNIPKVVAAVVSMVARFVSALAANVGRVITAGQDLILKLIGGIASIVPRLVTLGAGIILKFLGGIQEAIPKIRNKAVAVARAFLTNLASGLVELADIGFHAVINFLHGIASVIRNNDDALISAGADILDALVDGMVKAAGPMAGRVKAAIEALFGQLPGWAKKILGIHSPSAVFMEIGRQTLLGFKKGMEDNQKEVTKPVISTAQGLIDKIKSILGIHSPSEVMRDIGQQVNRGFADGLRGSQDDIRSAFKDLNDKLREQIRAAKETIVSEQGKLDDLLKAKKPDYAAIAESRKAIAESEDVLARSRAGRASLISGLKVEEKQLIRLKDNFAALTTQLEDAQRVLDDAIRTRDDAQRSYADKYGATPDITTDEEDKRVDPVQKYKDQLNERIIATKSYAQTLQKLRELGLDDTTYKKLLDQGLEGQKFAEQLLAGGKGGIEALNALDQQLAAAAGTLAQNAATNLYQAGVDAAQGLVNGLAAKKADLEKLMEDIAASMVRAIKRKLKIKSPSQEFIGIANLIGAGLVKGLQDSSKQVSDATANLGIDTLQAMRSTVSRISDMVSSNMDVEPVITPVLDLSNVEKNAGRLGDLTNVTPITAAASFGQAATVSSEFSAAQRVASEASAAGNPTFMFEQNNYSPEALSDVEIYRKTNNQLAQLRNSLGIGSQ